MKSIIMQSTATMTIAASFFVSSSSHAAQGKSERADIRVQTGRQAIQVQPKFQIAPRGGMNTPPFNSVTTVNGSKSGNLGTISGGRVVFPSAGQGTGSGLPFVPGKLTDQKHTMPFNPNVKIPIDPGFGKGPKFPIDPGFGKGPKVPIDPGIGNGQGVHHHHHPHNWCGGICRPNWVCPTIWWYPTHHFCTNLTGGYFANPEVIVVDRAVNVDVALADVRFCDAGDVVSKLGPRYRIMVRNKGHFDVGPFHVVVMAGMDKTPKPDSPASLFKVIGLRAGETKAFDVRLPAEALTMGVDPMGTRTPFSTMFVAVDSHVELNDMDRTNNGTVMNRMEIPLVD